MLLQHQQPYETNHKLPTLSSDHQVVCNIHLTTGNVLIITSQVHIILKCKCTGS